MKGGDAPLSLDSARPDSLIFLQLAIQLDTFPLLFTRPRVPVGRSVLLPQSTYRRKGYLLQRFRLSRFAESQKMLARPLVADYSLLFRCS